MSVLAPLAPLRAHAGQRLTAGLDDATVARLAPSHPDLAAAIEAAAEEYARLYPDLGALLDLDEAAQIETLQAGFVNFYADDCVTPYVALAARGPWVVSLKGAVLYDAGGYGMLGFGHAPAAVIEAMSRPQVMANVMTPNLAQHRFSEALRREIGHTRGGCPYARFMCLNSGSEAVGLATRVVDINAKLQTDPGARHAGATIKRVVVKGSFHGRTDRPGLYSDSSRRAYVQHLASYRGEDSVIVIPPYDVAALRQAFADAATRNWFIEAVFLEPVMGEGDPGRAVPVEFYSAARELTRAHGSLLLIDSIQAGLRAHGVLSLVDYPGFEGVEPPDMETYSKALNAAQFPLSVLAVNARAADLYRKGVYGNTMTTNPRALDVACELLSQLTPALRANLRNRGV
jgi:acetylornithine/succinyldiaminopimelate/putrescine aminotransferase